MLRPGSTAVPRQVQGPFDHNGAAVDNTAAASWPVLGIASAGLVALSLWVKHTAENKRVYFLRVSTTGPVSCNAPPHLGVAAATHEQPEESCTEKIRGLLAFCRAQVAASAATVVHVGSGPAVEGRGRPTNHGAGGVTVAGGLVAVATLAAAVLAATLAAGRWRARRQPATVPSAVASLRKDTAEAHAHAHIIEV